MQQGRWHLGLAWLLVAVIAVFLFRTAIGLRLRGVGEQPDAAETLGVNVTTYRVITVLLAGALCGLAGAQLSLGTVNIFAEDMSAGRGWIAVVVVMLSRDNPLYAAGACVLFTFAPRTPALAAMHAVGRLFPRGDRAPAIEPIGEQAIGGLIAATPDLVDWRPGRTARVARGFYISQALELRRR